MAGMAAQKRRRRIEWLAFALVAAAFVTLTGWIAGEYGREGAAETLRTQATGSVTLDIAVLRSELEKQRALPTSLPPCSRRTPRMSRP
jgi:two-component system C4-dicarboxylate transport sensor histidine kinase DctB